jgi:hypothetical protein
VTMAERSELVCWVVVWCESWEDETRWQLATLWRDNCSARKRVSGEEL